MYSGPSPSHHAFMRVSAACECNCGLHIWYLGLVVKFSLTGSLSGRLLSLVCGVAAAVVARIQRLFVAANDLLQRLLWEVKRCPIVYFFILAWKTVFDSFTA